MTENPYTPPPPETTTPVRKKGTIAKGYVRRESVVPRYIAATLDNVLALLGCVLIAKSFEEYPPALPTTVAVASYLGYYALLEGLIGSTIGKLLTGLVVVQTNGQRCTWTQILLRTATRLLEVNPALCGAIPAAVFILLSSERQRYGDRLAGTIVVRRNTANALRLAD